MTDEQQKIYREIQAERNRQDKKWGPCRDLQNTLWVTILTEEVGEAAESVLEKDPVNLRKELIQIAAVAVAWIERIRAPLVFKEKKKNP